MPAARERLRRLARTGYLELIPTDTYGGYRLLDRGVRLVACKRAGRLRRRRGSATIPHAMLVAELAEWHLARRYPNGGTVRWYTEQDIRDGVDWLPLPHRRGRFCLPDGVLELLSLDGEVKRCAIEVERTGKVPTEYPPKLRWYARKLAEGTFQQVRWFVAKDAEAVVRRAVEAAGRGDAMRVLPLPDGVRLYT